MLPCYQEEGTQNEKLFFQCTGMLQCAMCIGFCNGFRHDAAHVGVVNHVCAPIYTIYNIIIHTVHTCMSCNHINISYYNLYIYLYIYNIIILYMHSNVQILPLNGINTLGQQVLNQQWAANGPRCAVREKFGLSNQKSWKSKMLTKTVIGVT